MAVVPEMVPGEQALPNAYNDQHTVVDALSIVSFMSRPQLIVKNLIWEKTDDRGVDLFDKLPTKGKMFIPDLTFTKMLKNKLDGITSFRATAVLRLQFQTQPFQAGRLIFGAIPMPTLIRPRNTYLGSHPSLLQSINHVQVDINKHTEISLRIPFVSPFNSYNLIDGKYPWAELVLMVYSKLSDPQVMTVPIRVYAHFEDIELGTPCSSEIGNVDAVPPPKLLTPESPDVPDNPDRPRLRGLVVQQSGRPRRQLSAAVVNTARAKESNGRVAGILDPIGKGAQAIYTKVGDTIPFLKPVTDVFSQLSTLGGEFVHNLFGWLGFSKPQTSYAGMNVLPRPTEFFCNANGVDHSHVLALDKLNAVDEFPGLGGTSFDEMDMNYIIRIPQWIGSFSYKTKRDVGKEGKALWTSYVSPNYFLPGVLRVITPMNPSWEVNGPRLDELHEKQPTILNYASSFFMYWTGSLTYTFRFMKTSFHSGRLRITFHPFTNTVDRDRLDYVYNTIIDLRENSEVSLTVPYVAPQPWKRVQFFDPTIEDPAKFWNKYGPGVTGRIEVNPITDLICSNNSVDTEIECVVEVRAGDDFKLSAPIRSGYYPFTVNPAPVAVQQSGVFALAGTQETRTAAIEGFQPLSITTSPLDIHRQDTQKVCAGETFSNFRTLIKRFTFVEKVTFDANNETLQRRVSEYINPTVLQTKPFFAYITTTPLPGVKPKDNTYGSFGQIRYRGNSSPLCSIGSLYAFYRGGLRVKVYCGNEPKLLSCRLVDRQDVAQKRGSDKEEIQIFNRRAIPFNAPTAYEFTKYKGFAEFQVPFYSPVILGVCSKYSSESEFDKSSAVIDISAHSDVKDKGKDEITCNIAVAGADDFSFHGFIGVPPVISINTLNDFYDPPIQKDIPVPKWIEDGKGAVSLVDTSEMAVDPTYPLNQFTPKDSGWQGWNPNQIPLPNPPPQPNPFTDVEERFLRFCILGVLDKPGAKPEDKHVGCG